MSAVRNPNRLPDDSAPKTWQVLARFVPALW